MKVPFSVLDRQYQKYQEEYEEKALKVLRKGWYILGEEVENFEKEYSEFIGTDYCLGIDNGLNALVLAFRALNIGKGDEVIVQGNTFIATIMGITINGATPIFVEPNIYDNIDVDKIEEKITDKTKAICVVHFYGQATEMDKVLELCKKYNLKLVEDCAQAHEAEYKGKRVGSFGDIGCFSFYPGKNLGCFGDGGAITTNNKEIYDRIKVLRSYGSEKKYHHVEVGYNARLDELQAGLLRVKLSHLSELTEERRKELVQGNVRTDDFVDVWENKFKWFRNLDKLKCKECENCKDWKYCRGDSLDTWDFNNNRPKLCLSKILEGDV